MTEETMLERMACAIYGPHATKKMVQDAGEWVNCLCSAKAALEAIREPSEGFHDAYNVKAD